MSQILIAENFPPSIISDSTQLSANAALGQAVISTEAIGSFTSGDYVLVGEQGQETAELLKILSISAKDITFTTNLASKHYQTEKIYKLRANQIKFYRAENVNGTAPVDASFSIIATVNIKPDQIYTEYSDGAGGADYWYKYTFYNETTASESLVSDAVAIRGGNTSYYVSVEEVRQEAGMRNNRWLSDTFILSKLQFAQGEVDSVLITAGYSLPFTTVPELVKNVTLLLAAGYLLTSDYGPEYEGLSKDGNSKIAQARKILESLKGADSSLPNGSGGSVTKVSGVRGYPDESAASKSPSEDFMFKVTDIY